MMDLGSIYPIFVHMFSQHIEILSLSRLYKDIVLFILPLTRLLILVIIS
jgi:hypothetical protein